jgi:hypothetical protein
MASTFDEFRVARERDSDRWIEIDIGRVGVGSVRVGTLPNHVCVEFHFACAMSERGHAT